MSEQSERSREFWQDKNSKAALLVIHDMKHKQSAVISQDDRVNVESQNKLESRISVKKIVELFSQKAEKEGNKVVFLSDNQKRVLKINQPWQQRLKATRMSDYTSRTTAIRRESSPDVNKTVNKTKSGQTAQLTVQSVKASTPLADKEIDNFYTPPATPVRTRQRSMSCDSAEQKPIKRSKMEERRSQQINNDDRESEIVVQQTQTTTPVKIWKQSNKWMKRNYKL